MYKISIIIPIYNVEEYLPQCLESVIRQTYPDLEIILVNDGSTDSCAAICEAYAQKDSRIQVIHKKNGGLSDARNAGLRMATGDFISFVDSDDVLDLHFCQKLLSALLENKADIAECRFIAFEQEDELKNWSSVHPGKTEVFRTDKALELLMHEHFKQVVWNKLYRKEVIAGLEFPVGKINEDEFWTYQVFSHAQKILRIQEVLYFYRQQESSIMGRRYSISRLDGLQALEERIGFIKIHFPHLENLAIQKFCLGALWHYQQISLHSEIDADQMSRKGIARKVKKYNRHELYKRWNRKDIFWYKLFLLSPALCMLLKNYNDRRIEMRDAKHA